MVDKVVSLDSAIATIDDEDTVCISGFVGIGTPETLLRGIEERFVTRQAPKNLSLLFAAAPGDGKEKGLNRIAKPGLIKRAIGGHWSLVPKLGAMAIANEIEAYNLPLGCISQLYRDIAAGKPGMFSRVGLHTFVDPRQTGGAINDITKEPLVEVKELLGEEWLFYHSIPVDVALIRGTTADPSGNITMEREALTLDMLPIAMAAKNSGGLVIAQVERIAAAGSLNPREVIVPGNLVDCVVVAEPDEHWQTYQTPYEHGFSGGMKSIVDHVAPMELNERKIIARRAAMELPVNGVVNLGIGMPEGQQFDFYDGGGLDLCCLGMAEVDQAGNVNVSMFKKRFAGAGGFINISQNARKVVFVGTFTAGGLKVKAEGGQLEIMQEGKARKFEEAVEQITFNGRFAADQDKEVLYITERCVFKLTGDGLELIEIAPGIDIEKDILAQMNFEPIMLDVKEMDARIFRQKPMNLRKQLLEIPFTDRLYYDEPQNIVFSNLSGFEINTKEELEAFNTAANDFLSGIGQKVNVIANYDGISIAPKLSAKFANILSQLEYDYYLTSTHYTTSAFLRQKLGEDLKQRSIQPHIFETQQEAAAFIKATSRRT